MFKCNRRATCNCGLAVREHSDVIRINQCGNPYAAPRVEVARQPLRDGTVIQRSTDGRNIMIYFPSGRELKVDAFGCLNGYLSVPGSDEGQGRGLCGTLDGHYTTDLTFRGGQVDHFTHSCNGGYHCHPTHFILSWGNPTSTSLFHNIPSDLDKHTTGQPKYCQCDTHIHGSPRVNCTAGGDIPHKAQTCSSNCPDVTAHVPQIQPDQGGVWTRRETVYVDQDEADPPQVITTDSSPPLTVEVTWPTPSGISREEAERRCQEALQTSPLYSHCAQHSDSLAFTVDSCVSDVGYGDNYDMVEAAVAAFTAQCQFQARQDPHNYVQGPDGSPVLKPQFADVCSPACLRHGRCERGTCQCQPGYTGDSCQLRAGQPPVLERVRGSSFCDLNQRPCRTIYFDASHFQMGDDFKCRVHTVLADGRLSETVFEDDATFISGDRLSCHLPDAKNRSKTTFSMSVTYDGSNYSNSKHVTVYDSTCQACNDSGCVHKSNTCLIDDLCSQNGDYNKNDETKMCNTSSSTVQWTTNTLAHFPKISAPILTGPDRNFMMSCAIPSSSRAPSARFRVTWYADAVTVIGQKTVDNDTRVAKLSVFDLPSGRLDLQCKVTSFYAGNSNFSPQLASAVFPWQSA